MPGASKRSPKLTRLRACRKSSCASTSATQGGTETQLFTDLTAEINATTPTEFDIESVQGAFTCDATDRMVIKYYAKTTSSGARTFTLYFQGTERYSHISTPVLFASLTVATDTIWDCKRRPGGWHRRGRSRHTPGWHE